jgi:hypothetical protein
LFKLPVDTGTIYLPPIEYFMIPHSRKVTAGKSQPLNKNIRPITIDTAGKSWPVTTVHCTDMAGKSQPGTTDTAEKSQPVTTDTAEKSQPVTIQIRA